MVSSRPEPPGTGWWGSAGGPFVITYATCASVDSSYEVLSASGVNGQLVGCSIPKTVVGGGADLPVPSRYTGCVASATCIRLVVHGSVQGVGFRFAACQAASECAVTGWVRNLPDGSVEIVAQGSPDAVAHMTTWAQRGPRYAAVDRVQIETLAASSELDAFEIRR